jgi:hypothetical protein
LGVSRLAGAIWRMALDKRLAMTVEYMKILFEKGVLA